MSGGSYDYFFSKVNAYVDELRFRNRVERDDLSPLQRRLREAFAQHMEAVSVACKAIEWADSADTSQADAEAALESFFDRYCGGGRVKSKAAFDLLAAALKDALA